MEANIGLRRAGSEVAGRGKHKARPSEEQRWKKAGGGFMTTAHKGRCVLDPKLMAVTTPGAGNPDINAIKKKDTLVPGSAPFSERVNSGGDMSALSFAARFGQTSAVSLLLERGFDIEVEVNKPFWTSLHRAAAPCRWTAPS